jgi:hypothetical protein
LESRGDYFQFDLVFIKKIIIKPNFFLKKPKPVQTNRFRFGFLGQKLIQTSLALVFSGLAQFFLIFFCLGLVRFGFGFRFKPV